MTTRKRVLCVDLEGAIPGLAVRNADAPPVPELAEGVRVDFLRSRSARFHAGVIALVAGWHRDQSSLQPCYVGREYGEEIALLARSPAIDGHNPIAAPYRAILAMWAEYDDERGIRTDAYRSYAIHIGDRCVPNEAVPPGLQELLLHLLKGSGEATPRNLRLRLDLESCGIEPGDVEIRGWSGLHARLKAGTAGGQAGSTAATCGPGTGPVGTYEGLSLDTAGASRVQRFGVEFTTCDDGVRVSVLADPFAYSGRVEAYDAVFYVFLEGARHPELLTFVLERPLSNDHTVLNGVFCAINAMRRPVAGKLLLRRVQGAVEPSHFELEDCDETTAAFLKDASGGLLVV